MSPVCPHPSRLRLDPVSYESLRRFRVEPDYAVYSVPRSDAPQVVTSGAIKSASQLCRFLMHLAPVVSPTSVRSQDP